MLWDFSFNLKNTHILTSWYVVPVGSVDDVVVSEEVLVVAGPPVRVGHHLVRFSNIYISTPVPTSLAGFIK